MANTYTLISSNVLAASAASVTFSSIPATYTDLTLKLSGRGDEAAALRGVILTLNGVGGTSYSNTTVTGDGLTALSNRASSQASLGIGVISGGSTTANTFGSLEFYLPSYTASQNKPLSGDSASEDNSSTATRRGVAGLFSNTSTISSMTLTLNSGSFVSGSSFYLYGIKNS